MKIVTKIIQYIKTKFSPENVTVITSNSTSGLSAFLYEDKVMVGNAEWKFELNSCQADHIKSIAKSSKSDALTEAVNCYHDFCNRYISC